MRMLVLFAGLFCSVQASAETWIVGSMEGFAPFNYSVDGEYSGIDVEILEEAAETVGVELEHRPMPWKRALLDFEAGSLDAIFQLTPTEQRFAKWNMVGPLRTTRTVFVTRAGSELVDVKSLEDLQSLVIGVVDGFTYDRDFDADTRFTKEYASDDFANMRKLLLGRVDIIAGGQATLAFVIRELNAQEKLKILPTPLVEQARYIAFSRSPDGDEKAMRLQSAIENMHNTGRISEIIHSYLER